MITFMLRVMHNALRCWCNDVMFVHADIGTQCYVDGWGGVGWGGVGWGGVITFMLRVMQLRCWCNVRARWHRYAVLRWWVGWGGVGWGGMITFMLRGISQRWKKNKWVFNQVTRFKLRKTTLGSASQNQQHETLIYVVKNAQTHAVPMGKALNEARVYRTTDRCWLPYSNSGCWKPRRTVQQFGLSQLWL